MLKRILFLFFIISFLSLLLIFNFSIGFDSSNYNASFTYNYDTRILYVGQIDNPSNIVTLPPIPEGFKHYILTYPQDNHYWYIIVCDDPIMVDASGRYVSSGTNNLSVYSSRTGYSEWSKLKNFQFDWIATNKEHIFCSDYVYFQNNPDFYLPCFKFDIYNGNGIVSSDDVDYRKFQINVSTTEPTSSLTFYTNYFNISDFEKYKVYISEGNLENWKLMNYESLSTNDGDFFRFTYDISKNGDYYFKFSNLFINFDYYISFKITNIVTDVLNFYLSTTEPTVNPIYLYSTPYYYGSNINDYDASKDFLNNYDVEISYGYDMPFDWAVFTYTGYDEEKGQYFNQYRFNIVVNGIYKVKILNLNTGDVSYQTFVVDNIGIDNKYGDDIYYDNYDEDGKFRPTPVLFLDYVDTMTVRIRTQPFTFNELLMLKCSTKFENEDFKENRNIYSYTVDTGNSIYDDIDDTLVKQDTIELSYFYIDVQIDGNYTFQFYNLESKEYTEASIYVNIRDFITDNIDNIDKFSDKMIAWCKLHFGFLTYPFEVAVNIFGRAMNINYEEPVINIPELKDPTTKETFFKGVSYNFNEAVNINDTTRTIYDIYLIVVNVILIFLFVILLKKVFEGVFK